jgi:hypothetical protein
MRVEDKPLQRDLATAGCFAGDIWRRQRPAAGAKGRLIDPRYYFAERKLFVSSNSYRLSVLVPD